MSMPTNRCWRKIAGKREAGYRTLGYQVLDRAGLDRLLAFRRIKAQAPSV